MGDVIKLRDFYLFALFIAQRKRADERSKVRVS